MLQRLVLMCLLTAAGDSAAHDAEALLARAKTATGGAHWDAVAGVHARGELAAAGLSGALDTREDWRSGRHVSRYTLGDWQGAEGYDGKAAWQLDPGGEVGVLDDAQALRQARSEAWLTAHGYWYPQRFAAEFGAVTARVDGARRFHVAIATPAGGEPVELWFDDASGRIERSAMQVNGRDRQVTDYADWRRVDGLLLPFAIAQSRGGDARGATRMNYAAIALGTDAADADFAPPAMADRAHLDDPSGIARIPFHLARDHIHVDAEVDGQPVHMLVDTGGMNILLPAAMRRLGLHPEGKLEGRGVGEDSTDVALTRARRLRLGAVSIGAPVFYQFDFGRLPDVEGEDFDGVIGYELFQRFGVTIDYAAHELRLTKPERFLPPPGAQALPFTLSDRIPIVQGRIDGLPARFSIDTGSGSTLDLHAPFVRRNALAERYRPRFQQIVGWGVGGPVRGAPVRLPSVQLGDVRLDQVNASLFSGDKGAFAGDDVDANLGGRILGRFTVAFDYAHKTLYLAPNTHYGDPFPYDRSGLTLIRHGDAIEVFEVLPDGPAANAGLRPGDVLATVGGDAVGTRSLSQWRAYLTELSPGRAIEIAYRREAAQHSTKLVPADLLPPTATP